MRKVLAVDLGGTKIAAAIITEKGEVLHRVQDKMGSKNGPEFVLEQIEAICMPLLKIEPEVTCGAIASAGPLDPKRGVLLNPTNMITNGQHWGEVPIIKKLENKLNLPLSLENDAAAAVLAERWQGRAKGYDNCLIMTLGTGVGIGAIANGELVRAGRGLHPEASHIYINAEDIFAPSGNGDFGSVEAYLSGTGFTKRVAKLLELDSLSGEELLNFAELGDPRIINQFRVYAKHMAFAINEYVVLYAPEIVVFAGGFSAAAKYFLEDTTRHLEDLLKLRRVGIDLMPHLAISSAGENMTLLGAGYVALQFK